MADKFRQRRKKIAEAASRQKTGGESRPRRSRRAKVSRKAKTAFTTQLAILQDAGLPILRSLRILDGQLPPGPMKEAVALVSEDVETGASLSEALAKHPAVFDDLYVNMVRAGEASGALTTIFNRLAEFMEKADTLRRKIRGAFIYPTFIVVFATLIVVFIMVYVVPKFQDTFSQLGGQLPGLTQFLIDVSSWMVERWYVLLGVPVLIWLLMVLVGRTPGGRRFIDGFKLRMWVFGPINLKSQIARFSRTLGTLSQSGVPLLQSLEIVGEASGNVVVGDAIDQVRDAVREGEPMARPMGETGLFDDLVVNMVDVGEETGELDRMLMRIADNNEEEVDARVAGLMSVLEPTLIVVMGLVVGFIVIALFLPLLKLQEMIGK